MRIAGIPGFQQTFGRFPRRFVPDDAIADVCGWIITFSEHIGHLPRNPKKNMVWWIMYWIAGVSQRFCLNGDRITRLILCDLIARTRLSLSFPPSIDLRILLFILSIYTSLNGHQWIVGKCLLTLTCCQEFQVVCDTHDHDVEDGWSIYVCVWVTIQVMQCHLLTV